MGQSRQHEGLRILDEATFDAMPIGPDRGSEMPATAVTGVNRVLDERVCDGTAQPGTPRQRLRSLVAAAVVACLVLAGGVAGWLLQQSQTRTAENERDRLASQLKHLQGNGNSPLFSITVDECAALRAAPDKELVERLSASTDPRVREFVKRCKGDPVVLRAAVETLLCPDSRK